MPAAGVMVHHLGDPGDTFTSLVTRWAVGYAPPDRVMTWARCPNGATHSNFPWSGTPTAHRLAQPCAQCAKTQAWVDSLPTFAEEYPAMVPYLADPQDACARGKEVLFRCGECPAVIRWSPRSGGVPVCGYCRATGGQPPGTPVTRQGGGDSVALEGQLAAALNRVGLVARDDLGIVVPRGAYHVGVIKPDVLLTDHRVALELDLDRPPNRHCTPAGIADDQLRDRLLSELGWAVLRIRLPQMPTKGAWPIRVETRSTSPARLAEAVKQRL